MNQTPTPSSEPTAVNVTPLPIRLASASLLGAFGAWVGHTLGKSGDNATHKMAQWSFRAIGAVFGVAISWYATRPEADRSQQERDAMVDRPYVSSGQRRMGLMDGPAGIVDAASVSHAGQVENASRELNR